MVPDAICRGTWRVHDCGIKTFQLGRKSFLPPTFEPAVLQRVRLQGFFPVGCKALNIAIQLVLQQCCPFYRSFRPFDFFAVVVAVDVKHYTWSILNQGECATILKCTTTGMI